MRPFLLRREVTLGLLVYALYLLVRKLVLDGGGRARAQRNAERIVALERRLRLDFERNSDAKSKTAVAEQFSLSEQQVRRIEQEGLDSQWPPLAE